MKHENVIAIDPDKEKSGVAFLKVKTRQLEVTNLSFPLLLEYLQHAKAKRDETGESLIVVVEAGWMNKKSCFHAAQGKQAEKIAKAKAETEFEKYRVIQDRLFMSDFDKYMLELEENAKK